MRRSKHLCRAEGCAATVWGKAVFCQAHWRLVPYPNRDAIQASYAGLFNGPVPFTQEERFARIEAYKKAIADAVAAIAKNLSYKTGEYKIKTKPPYLGDHDTERTHAAK